MYMYLCTSLTIKYPNHNKYYFDQPASSYSSSANETNTFPFSTKSPSFVLSFLTVPALGALMTYSIFIAIMTTRGSPASTTAPSSTITFSMTPGMGATVSPRPPINPPYQQALDRKRGANKSVTVVIPSAKQE